MSRARLGPPCEHLGSALTVRPSLSGFPQSRDRKMVGDVIGAQSYASTAKCLNISALVLSIILVISLIFVFVFTSVQLFT